ncbi:MAG: response regulator [Eubacteriales bacterium]|nr:response regulator [Eubacteriales bacterium]
MMILCADDEPLALDVLTEAVKTAAADAEVNAFDNAFQLLDFAKTVHCDIAFLDIEMRDMSGLVLAKHLKDYQPKINIVFVTGYGQYTANAIGLRASGYVLKPATPAKIREELENLRNPVPKAPTNLLRVQCFGSFEVYQKGKPLPFSRHRSKELFAYLINRRGTGSSMKEIAAVLWEDGVFDRSRRNQLHTFLSELSKTLDEAGAGNVLIRQYNSYAVDPRQVDCDYYRCLQNDPAAINAYCGEYMAQYSWAEFTAGVLTRKLL